MVEEGPNNSNRMSMMRALLVRSLKLDGWDKSAVGKAAAQDAGLSEGEETHEVGVKFLQGAGAQQDENSEN